MDEVKSENTDFEDYNSSESNNELGDKPEIDLSTAQKKEETKSVDKPKEVSLFQVKHIVDPEELKRKRDELMTIAITQNPEEDFGVLDKVFQIPIISLPKTYPKEPNPHNPNEPQISSNTVDAPIYKLTTLFYTSNKDFYIMNKSFIDLHDGTAEIEDFEKTCSLGQSEIKELIGSWKEKQKDKKRFIMNKDMDKKQQEFGNLDTGDIPKKRDDYLYLKGDIRKDIENPISYPECRSAIRDCNQLNGYEFYDQLLQEFCNDFYIGYQQQKSDQSTADSERIDTAKIKRKLQKEPNEDMSIPIANELNNNAQGHRSSSHFLNAPQAQLYSERSFNPYGSDRNNLLDNNSQYADENSRQNFYGNLVDGKSSISKANATSTCAQNNEKVGMNSGYASNSPFYNTNSNYNPYGSNVGTPNNHLGGGGLYGGTLNLKSPKKESFNDVSGNLYGETKKTDPYNQSFAEEENNNVTERTANFNLNKLDNTYNYSDRQVSFRCEFNDPFNNDNRQENDNQYFNEKNRVVKHEKDINDKFNLFLTKKYNDKIKKPLLYLKESTINKDLSLAHNHIFKYEDLSYKFESSMLETNNQLLNNKKGDQKAKLGKRLRLDYDMNVNEANAYKLQKGEYQKNGQIIYYKNFDLRYSTWYDSIANGSEKSIDQNVNEVGKNPVVKNETNLQDPYNCYSNSLLIDLNDRNVQYDRLNVQIKPGAIDQNDPNFENLNNQNANDLDSDDGNNPYENDKLNFKNLQQKNGIKTLNQYKKALRLKIFGHSDQAQDNQNDMNGEGNDEQLSTFNNYYKFGNNASRALDGGLVKKRRNIVNFTHSDVASNFEFTNFRATPARTLNLHRYNIADRIYSHLLKDINTHWRVSIVNKNKENLIEQNLAKIKRNFSVGNSKEMVDSHAIFSKQKRLSLKSDQFILFEYVEKEPQIMGNVGMASRLTKYIYPHKVVKTLIQQDKIDGSDEKGQVEAYKTYTNDTFGVHGDEQVLKEKEKLPINGQLTNSPYTGIALLENNLSHQPVFAHKPKKTDFVLVVVNEKGKTRYYQRKIKSVYTTGQIQPKLEVFCHHSRHYRSFLKKLMKYVISKSFSITDRINFDELRHIMPLTLNDHQLRKHIKMLGGEQDTTNPKLYHFNQFLYNENKANDYGDEIDASITPEELCLYERMYQSMNKNIQFGIETLKSSDKISVIRTKFYMNNIDNTQKCAIAQRIIEELYLTAWNLSQSFLSATQTQGRMYLEGYGDPTNGHGGMNFIKLPLKISRYESQLFKKHKKGIKSNMVTGTGADQRCLSMKKVHEVLKYHGYSDEKLSKLERWDKIDILRDIANRQQDDERFPYLSQYKRDKRMTTQMQKKEYQNKINKLFNLLIKNLQMTSFDQETGDNIKEILSFEDDDGKYEEDFNALAKKLEQDKVFERYRDLINADQDINSNMDFDNSAMDNESVQSDRNALIIKGLTLKTDESIF